MDEKLKGEASEPVIEPRGRNIGYLKVEHPSRRLELRLHGYGIGGGYERPYRKEKAKLSDSRDELYGPLPHSGYYGGGTGARRFKVGQAGFRDELEWYKKQFGETTSDYVKE